MFFTFWLNDVSCWLNLDEWSLNSTECCHTISALKKNNPTIQTRLERSSTWGQTWNNNKSDTFQHLSSGYLIQYSHFTFWNSALGKYFDVAIFFADHCAMFLQKSEAVNFLMCIFIQSVLSLIYVEFFYYLRIKVRWLLFDILNETI